LWNGIFDFLDALGIRWPAPGKEELPAPNVSVQLARTSFNCLHIPPSGRKRLFIKEDTGAEKMEALVEYAAHNKYDALVFSSFKKLFQAERGRAMHSINKYALSAEACLDISSLLPRRLFLFNSSLFRMEEGKRRADIHF
jgi:hypothetical protein